MRYLEQMGVGLEMAGARVPIVPAAVLFDLGVGDSAVRPDASMGISACMSAAKGMAQGAVGAGCGATVGKLVVGSHPQQGGVGSASITLPEGVTVGAVVAVNAVGDVYHPVTGECIACASLEDGTRVRAEGLLCGQSPAPQQLRIPAPGSNTTIGVVAVDCALTKEQANRLADVAHDGLARAIRPVHTQMDGDTMFALATGRVGSDVNFVKLCAAAAEVTARAIANAILFSLDALSAGWGAICARYRAWKKSWRTGAFSIGISPRGSARTSPRAHAARRRRQAYLPPRRRWSRRWARALAPLRPPMWRSPTMHPARLPI